MRYEVSMAPLPLQSLMELVKERNESACLICVGKDFCLKRLKRLKTHIPRAFS